MPSAPVDPFTGRNRLTGSPVRAEGGPVTLLLVAFIRDRALQHKNERVQFIFRRQMETLHKLVSILRSEKGVMEMHLGNPRQRSEHNILDAGLCRCRHSDCVPVATQARSYPENVALGDGGAICGLGDAKVP
jgi:hypothetical protein